MTPKELWSSTSKKGRQTPLSGPGHACPLPAPREQLAFREWRTLGRLSGRDNPGSFHNLALIKAPPPPNTPPPTNHGREDGGQLLPRCPHPGLLPCKKHGGLRHGVLCVPHRQEARANQTPQGWPRDTQQPRSRAAFQGRSHAPPHGCSRKPMPCPSVSRYAGITPTGSQAPS